MRQLPWLDIAVIVLYLAAVAGLGVWFGRRSRDPEQFTSAGGSLPAWAVGLSIFGTYVSSISFLALPGKAFTGNWNPFVFSLSLPLAAWIGVRFFVPFYRRRGHISAYEHLEERFGPWARSYAAVFYLLTQMGRMGTVLFLLALPLSELVGWSIPAVILVVGGVTTVYTLVGGITAVIYTDAVQSVILIGGALLCAILLPLGMPDGPAQMMQLADAHDKFSLGSFAADFTTSTFWVVLLYGVFINLNNYGIDQSYIQRYLTAKSDRAAANSLWLGALLYLPVSALFFFIGTALFAYYTTQPELLSEAVANDVARGSGDRVFPLFIVDQLPAGVTGFLIAAIFAAAMSTLSTSVNCSATLTLTDFYRRYVNPRATERQSMRVLWAATFFWGAIGTAVALLMIGAKNVLDVWWKLAGIFSGGMLGLFLLGIISRRAGNGAALIGVVCGIVVILWMTLSAMPIWPEAWAAIRSPLHEFMIIVCGTITILLVGVFAAQLAYGLRRSAWSRTESHTP